MALMSYAKVPSSTLGWAILLLLHFCVLLSQLSQNERRWPLAAKLPPGALVA